MKQTLKKYVITGGPSTGKTSIISILQQKGFVCVDEMARQVIREQLELKTNYLPWADLERFSEIVVERMITQIKKLHPEDIHFFDRGIPDVIAYMKKADIPFSDNFYQLAEKFRYNNKVFIAPPWKEIYEQDNERREDYEEAEILYEHLKITYQELDYKVVDIPKGRTEERAKFIIEQLD